MRIFISGALVGLFCLLLAGPGLAASEIRVGHTSPRQDAKSDKNKISDLTFDDIAFDMKKGAKFERKMLTGKINKLHDSTVRLRGYIRPSFRQSGIKKFVFVRDNKECCFGPGAAIYDCVLVEMAKGKAADYTVRPITIEGRFVLEEFLGPDKNVWAIYRMKDGIVK